MSKSLILIGLKACGKTSVGYLLAQKMGVEFVDTDRLLLARYHFMSDDLSSPCSLPSCADIYRRIGEQAFRSLEKTVILDLQQTAADIPLVIATGGGVVLDPENRALLQQMGQVIYLSASYATLLSRLKANPLPAFMSGDLATELQALLTQRDPIYCEIADVILDTKQYAVTEVVGQLLLKCGGKHGK